MVWESRHSEDRHIAQASVPPTSTANQNTSEVFKKLHSTLLAVLWSHKKPRIKFALLKLGGMGLPDFRKYYIEAHLTRIID